MDLTQVNHKICWKQKRIEDLKKGQNNEIKIEETKKDRRISFCTLEIDSLSKHFV
jgi:hypothetical protein